jgi:hypothetical protein
MEYISAAQELLPGFLVQQKNVIRQFWQMSDYVIARSLMNSSNYAVPLVILVISSVL